MSTTARQPFFWVTIAAAILLFQAFSLWTMGRPPICTCGTIKFWHGVVNSSENSQHIADWYSFSHIIHGFIFYGVLHLFLPHKSLGLRLALAMGIEAGWEILENSDLIINRYRTATMALDYFGDSILNSVSDSFMAMLGFLFAAVSPVWVVVAIAIFFEAGTAWMIRDNLTLNIVMLLWPVDAVRAWQAGL
jgi:hypothetical protein